MSVLCGVTNQPQRQVSLTVKKQSPREYCSLLTLHQYSNLYQDSANIRALLHLGSMITISASEKSISMQNLNLESVSC